MSSVGDLIKHSRKHKNILSNVALLKENKEGTAIKSSFLVGKFLRLHALEITPSVSYIFHFPFF